MCELTPIVYYQSLNVWGGRFCLWADKNVFVHFSILASSCLYVCVSPKSLWHTQAVAVSSGGRQSFSFLLSMNFLDVCLASSTKD